jgi:hypothetical protein
MMLGERVFWQYRMPENQIRIKKVGKDIKVKKDGTYKGKLRTIDADSDYFLKFSHSEENFVKFTQRGEDKERGDIHINPAKRRD